jgi:3-oxoacyl-[acyl-carrier protein] reductase
MPEESVPTHRALIMGADDPVAAALALALAEAGADVALTNTTGDPEEAFSLRPLRRKIEALSRRAIADIADLSNGSSVQIAVRQIAKQLGSIDLLVIAPREALTKPSDRVTDADWSRAVNFNLGAYFFAARAAFREFADNPGKPKGRIIALLPAISSDASPILQASRSGAEALIQALAYEWAGYSVFVGAMALSPKDADSPAAAVQAVLRLAEAEMGDTGAIEKVNP